MDAYRFVVVYRSERRGNRGDGGAWRGWVEQVYPPPEDGGEARRLWFTNVAEISEMIAKSLPAHVVGAQAGDD